MNDNQEEPITPGCPSLMPHNLPGGFNGVEPGEDNKAGCKTEVEVLRECLKEACRFRCGKCRLGNLETESHFCGNYCDTIKRWHNALNGGRK